MLCGRPEHEVSRLGKPRRDKRCVTHGNGQEGRDSGDTLKTDLDWMWWVGGAGVGNKPPTLSFGLTVSEKMVRRWNSFSGKTRIPSGAC